MKLHSMNILQQLTCPTTGGSCCEAGFETTSIKRYDLIRLELIMIRKMSLATIILRAWFSQKYL